MKCRFLARNSSPELLIFFHGWGMGPDDAIGRLDAAGMDVLCCFDYTDPTPAFDRAELFGRYSTVYLAAWSLGVRAAATALAGVVFARALALNGTLEPISAECGIAPETFAGTIANWPDEDARRRFYRRVAGAMPTAMPTRPAPEQQRELESLARQIAAAGPPENIFDTVLIGTRDRIFPAAAQRAAWAKQRCRIVERELPHDPFGAWTSWREVIEL